MPESKFSPQPLFEIVSTNLVFIVYTEESSEYPGRKPSGKVPGTAQLEEFAIKVVLGASSTPVSMIFLAKASFRSAI